MDISFRAFVGFLRDEKRTLLYRIPLEVSILKSGTGYSFPEFKKRLFSVKDG